MKLNKELEDLKRYVLDSGSEAAKTHLVYPLFRALFPSKFCKESDAEGADTYIEGKLLVELKSAHTDWLSGLFQGLHYAKKGLSFPKVCVITHRFIGLWQVSTLPDEVRHLAQSADARKAPNAIGRSNARKLNKAHRNHVLQSSVFLLTDVDLAAGLLQRDVNIALSEFVTVLKNLDSARIQVNPRNFISVIASMETYFPRPMDAIHAFYDMCGYWDVTSKVSSVGETDELILVGKQGTASSVPIQVNPRHHETFKKFVNSRYVFTNEGSGLSVDFYFSRFDEVIARLDPEYARQHGIYFTKDTLSKFTSWYVHEYFESKLSDNYIVIDPAGGSGNLIASWRGHLKHKIISELQPDLLRTIERRLDLDPDHLGQFSIVPKTREGRGLNFLSLSADDYLAEIHSVIDERNLVIDKPLAFFLNPPYKSTDEHHALREETDSNYAIHEDILSLAGQDAGKERYLGFLAQILNISVRQNNRSPALKPLVMIFTPTSWLIPRPSYVRFRETFDRYFKFENGFIVTSNEFFKVSGNWPLAFTIWSFNDEPAGNTKGIILRDLTHAGSGDLDIDWQASMSSIRKTLRPLLKKSLKVNFSKDRDSIKMWSGQRMSDFKRSPTKTELRSNKIYGGLPARDFRRKNLKTYGVASSDFLGFMDNGTPVRIKRKENDVRFEGEPGDHVWFRLDNDFKSVNKTKIFGGPPDKYGYCAYDEESARKMFVWFAVTKALNGKYPIWANQFDIWAPDCVSRQEEIEALAFALGFTENRCVITVFPEGDPVPDAPRVFCENPFSPNQNDSFWTSVLLPIINNSGSELAKEVVATGKELYTIWNRDYCKGKTVTNVGLDEEPYFDCFDYDDFVTPNSGLVQIRRFADIHGSTALSDKTAHLSRLGGGIRSEIYSLLIDSGKYFN